MPLLNPQAFADSYDITPEWLCAAFYGGCRMTSWRPVGEDFETTWKDISIIADSVGWWDGAANFVIAKLDRVHECREGSFTVTTKDPIEIRRVV